MFFCQETTAQVKGLRVVAEVGVLVERDLETGRQADFLELFGITGILLINICMSSVDPFEAQ